MLKTPPRFRAMKHVSRDGLILLILGLVAMTLFNIARNPEIHGDDDFLYPGTFSRITDAILDFDISSLHNSGKSLANLALQVTCAPRHAPVPAVIHALSYLIFNRAGIPFSMNLIHLPIGIISTAAVLLLYLLLRRDKTRPQWVCLAGTLLLLCSPLFNMLSRGIGSYFNAFVPFILVTGLWGLDLLARAKSPSWRVGCILAFIVLGDLIWFITLPTLLLSYLLMASDRKQAFRQLISVPVLIPVMVATTLLLLATAGAYQLGLETPLSKLAGEHISKVNHGLPILTSPAYFLECLALMFGVLAPVALGAGITFWLTAGTVERPGLLTSFSLTGLTVYGLLFYGLTPEWLFVKISYQIYLILPFILIFVALLTLLSTRLQYGRRIGVIAATGLLACEVLGYANFIWAIPVSPFGTVFDGRDCGAVSSNQGTKAAGYVVRQWIEATWRRDPRRPVSLLAARYNTSFAIFSGMNVAEKGWPYVREFGPSRPVQVHFSVPALNALPPPTPGHNNPMVYLLDLTGRPYSSGALQTLFPSPEYVCYLIRSSNPKNEIAYVYILPPAEPMTPPVPPGEVNMETLEAAFDRTYTQYSDFFPQRLAK